MDTASIAATAKPAKLTDGRFVAIQVLAAPEVVADGDMLVLVRQWLPQCGALAPGPELCLPKSATVRSLFDAVERIVGDAIPRSALRLVKPWGWQLKQVDELPKLKWKGEESPDHLASAPPFGIKDGVVLLFKVNMPACAISVDVDGRGGTCGCTCLCMQCGCQSQGSGAFVCLCCQLVLTVLCALGSCRTVVSERCWRQSWTRRKPLSLPPSLQVCGHTGRKPVLSFTLPRSKSSETRTARSERRRRSKRQVVPNS